MKTKEKLKTNSERDENNSSKEQPWYKHPWVWFIIALPASAVIAGVITFYIAHQNAPQVIAKEHRFHINKD